MAAGLRLHLPWGRTPPAMRPSLSSPPFLTTPTIGFPPSSSRTASADRSPITRAAGCGFPARRGSPQWPKSPASFLGRTAGENGPTTQVYRPLRQYTTALDRRECKGRYDWLVMLTEEEREAMVQREMKRWGITEKLLAIFAGPPEDEQECALRLAPFLKHLERKKCQAK